jgi:hypothetical protein
VKLRLRGSSVRLRLTRSEVAAIGRGERVEEVTVLPDGSEFRYALVVVEDGEVTACMADGCLEVHAPRAVAAAWASSEDVAMGALPPLPVGACELLIEKDFACLHPRPEDRGDETFPHPTLSRDST